MAREKKGGHLLKFQKEGLKEVHLITEQINFPITCNGDNNIWIEGSGDKYYIVIKDTNTDVSGTITLNFSKKDHIGYQTDASVSNYFKVGIETTAIMSLESTEETTESSESMEESSETEESTMEEKSSEEETFESEESSTENNFSEKDTSSTEEESSETIDNSILEE